MPSTFTFAWIQRIAAAFSRCARPVAHLAGWHHALLRGAGRALAAGLALVLWGGPLLAQVAASEVTLVVDSPAGRGGHFSTGPRLDVTGTASSAQGIVGVWVQATSGPAQRARLQLQAGGTQARWSLPGVFLQPGPNLLRIRAVDGRQQHALHYLAVHRADAAPGPQPTLGTAPMGSAPAAFQVAQGRALVEGDIDIGPAEQAGRGRPGGVLGQGLGIATPAQLWPKAGGVAQIPYTASSGNAQVAPAIAEFNAVFTGVVQWVPRGAQPDFVDFQLDPNNHSGSAFSAVGRAGGQQLIGGSIDADLGTLLHEMGHAAGLLHEQSRADRNAYVSLLDANIIKTLRPNFDIALENAQRFGLYDYGSVMHYRPFTFSKNGNPTLESIPAGIPMSETGRYTAGDIDAVRRLYDQTPSAITITTNPPGLQVIVDGTPVTTPQTFNFAIGSTHTLDVPAAAQVLSGRNFTYGRWGDNTQRAHSFTVAKGNGLVGSPVNRPAVTVYAAHFVELMPWQPFTYPAGAGSVTPTPAPQAYPGLAGLHYPARTPVSLAAAPSAGYSLYRLYTAYGPVSQNPKTTYDPEWVLAYFTPQPRTTITTSPAGRWLWVDGQFYEGPVNFSPFYPADGDWSAGTVHQVDVAVNPQLPFSYSIRYPWLNWSDGGAASHNITVPAGNSTRTARFGTQYYAATWAQQPCAGSVTTSPAPADGFHDSGSTVSFLQTPVAGWSFTGWLNDFTGKTNPKSLAMTDERLMVANYNAATTPVAITSLTPATKVAGQAGFTLKIAGNGFTSNSGVFIGGAFRAPSSVSAKQIQVPVTAADIATAGALQVFVQTTPPGPWGCSAYAARSLQVRSSSTQPLAAASPTSLAFASQAVGSTSAAKTVTLTNGGNTPLALHDVVVTGTQAADFTLTHTCGSAVAAGASCPISVKFQPAATGARSASLLVLDTAFDSPQAVALTGTGSP